VPAEESFVSRSLRAFACALALLAPLFALAPARAAVVDTYEVKQQASFEIYTGDTRLGTEKFRVYAAHDTLITASTVRLDGLGPESTLPFEKRTTYLQRGYDSYPLVFQIVQEARSDTSQSMALNCVFRDTVAIIYKESGQRGVGTSVALPPGRLYILEPGIYLQVQLLLADFLAGSQDTRRQPVLIPSAEQVVDLFLKKGPVEPIVVRGHRVDARRIELTDKLTNLVAWMDEHGRLMKLEAPGQGLRVERGPEIAEKDAAPAKPAAKKPAVRPKRKR
jgi:hypothetical protein